MNDWRTSDGRLDKFAPDIRPDDLKMDDNFLLESRSDYKDCLPFAFGNIASRLLPFGICDNERRTDGDGCGPFCFVYSAKLQKLESYFIMKQRPEMGLTLRRDSYDR